MRRILIGKHIQGFNVKQIIKIAPVAILAFTTLASAISHNKPFAISIPKSGSTMLFKAMGGISGKPIKWVQKLNKHMPWKERNMRIDARTVEAINKSSDIWYAGHLYYTPRHVDLITSTGLDTIFIYRDPRDLVLSLISSRYSGTVLQQLGLNSKMLSRPKREAISYMITHINAIYNRYIGWIGTPQVYSVRFEDLVGPQGYRNSSQEIQVREIINIANHIGISISDNRALEIAQSLFGGTATFNKGQVGRWKKEFTKEHKALFKKHAGQLLIDLGYEKDFDW